MKSDLISGILNVLKMHFELKLDDKLSEHKNMELAYNETLHVMATLMDASDKKEAMKALSLKLGGY